MRGPIAWVLAWCAVLVAVDGVGLWLGSRGEPNLWLYNLVPPVGGALVLAALAVWQPGELPRLTIRLVIVPFVLLWAALTLAFEDSSTFSRAADPMASLVLLSAAAFTLVTRTHGARTSLLRHDWFWVSAGLALYFGTASAVGPLSALLVRSTPDLMVHAYEVKSLLDIVAFLLIARGVTCRSAT